MSLGLPPETGKAKGFRAIISLSHMTAPVGMGRLKKTRHQVDLNGNLLDPVTKEKVGVVEEPNYVPTAEDIAILSAKKGGDKPLSKEERLDPTINATPASPTGSSRIEQLIAAKIEAIIEKKVVDILEKMLG